MGPQQAVPVEPASNSWMQRPGAAQFLNSFLGGGNNIPEVSSGSRLLDLAMQREAQRQWAAQTAYQAVQAGKALQAQRAAQEARTNGVVDGVAYRGGQPVGFAGTVAGVRPGIPEGGFNAAESGLFARQMRNYLEAGPVQGPRDDIAGPLMAEGRMGPVMGAPVMPASAPTIASLPVTAQGLPEDTPEAASRAARYARGMPFRDVLRSAMDTGKRPEPSLNPLTASNLAPLGRKAASMVAGLYPSGSPMNPGGVEAEAAEVVTPQGAVVEYRFDKGDTIETVAKTFGTTPEALRKLNKLGNKALKIGDTLMVPHSVSS